MELAPERIRRTRERKGEYEERRKGTVYQTPAEQAADDMRNLANAFIGSIKETGGIRNVSF